MKTTGSLPSRGGTATVHGSRDQLLLLAGIVGGINVVELYRRSNMNLDCRFSAHHGVVVHAGIQKGKAAGGEAHHFALIELVAHANFDRSCDHSDVLAPGMPMRSNLVSIRSLQTDGVFTHPHGIA